MNGAQEATSSRGATDGPSSSSKSKGFDYRNSSEQSTGFDYRDEDGPLSRSYGDIQHSQPHHQQQHLEVDGHHSLGAGMGIELGFLPPDQRPGDVNDLLSSLVVDPDIDEDTEAAEALRANANVKVGKVGKVARSLNAQSVRKVAKRLTLRGQSGNRRGKPPRVPPGLSVAPTSVADGAAIYALDEEKSGDLDSSSRRSLSSGGFDDNHDFHQFSPSSPSRKRAEIDKSVLQHGELSPRARDEGSSSSPMPYIVMEDMEGKMKAPGRQARLSGIHNEDNKDIPVEVTAATMEAGRKLMGALDPHNMLQLQRWRRKHKKGGKKKRKSYVKGKVIDGRHELYTLSIAVMLGVRTSIARTNTVIASADRNTVLTPEDFMAEEKYEFAPKGSATTPPHKLSHTFKLKDYAPVAFAYLRRMFGVNEFDFLLSVCGNANFIEFISNAKSGQFFFYSSDGKYMIKTMTNQESKFLRRILPHYFRHCTQNPNTLLTRYLGMYRVKLYHLRRNVKFVIMNSVYYTDKSLQTFFDLKGSEQGREAKPGQEVLKDNDLRARLPEEAFSFAPDVKTRLRAQIVSDCNFLRRMHIMDYSMLIGVHHVPPKTADKSGSSVADSGLKIRERQASLRQGSNTSDPMTAAASAVKEMHDGGSHTDGESVDNDSRSTSRLDGKLGSVKPDSSRKIIKDIRETTFHATNLDFAGLLEEEDDCSYLEGSEQYKQHVKNRGASNYQRGMYDDVEIKKEQTVEQIYWPFHRFYDINGLRRTKPKPCFHCNTTPCNCEEHTKLVQAWKIPDFVRPLSDRKDGGLMMDTSGMSLLLTWHGPQGDRPYVGKIYYMGIIDILQQYNARKRVETTYRKMETHGTVEPSCVSPQEYAERFVQFFDEYAAKAGPKGATLVEESTEVEVKIRQASFDNHDVQISVSSKDDGVQQEPEGYKRDRVQLDADGKPILPKGKVVVT